MKVLSIDLDYITGPTAELFSGLWHDINPIIRWKELYDNSDFTESHLSIDTGGLIYCYHLFLKALKNNPTVVFGYEHDAILYELRNHDNIDIVNIDHHDDVMHGTYHELMRREGPQIALDKEWNDICKYNHVNEGNWGAWLHYKEKLNSFVWIANEKSGNLDRNWYNEQLLGDKYQTHLRQDYKFEDYNFDHVFVCLSPQYTPQHHWHYFTMFMMAYEEMTGKEIELISKTKYMFEDLFTQTTEYIVK